MWSLLLCACCSLTLSGAVSGQKEFAPLRGAVEELLPDLRLAQISKVAVVDFTDLAGNQLVLGRAVAEEISLVLGRLGKPLVVIDRSNLAALLREHKLTSSGLVDPATAKEFGRISGVDVLITGSLQLLNEVIFVRVKAIDVRTAAVVASSSTSLGRSSALDNEMRIDISRESDGVVPSDNRRGPEPVVSFERCSVRLLATRLLRDGAVLELALRNTSPGRGPIFIAVALAFDNSTFPTATLVDGAGGEYDAESGGHPGLMGVSRWFARQGNPRSTFNPQLWTKLLDEEVTATMRFRGGVPRNGLTMPLAVNIEFVYSDNGSPAVLRNARFADIRTK